MGFFVAPAPGNNPEPQVKDIKLVKPLENSVQLKNGTWVGEVDTDYTEALVELAAETDVDYEIEY